MSDDPERRLAINESTFRQVNEAIERGHWPGEEDAPVAFRCECARLGCNDLVELTIHDYEQVRANPRRFFVEPGHHDPRAEVIVERASNFVVVEKVGEAGDVAEETDPRS